jgi:hypothetical protein
MSKLLVSLLSVIALNAHAYTGAEVILGGVIGYIVGEKQGERQNQRPIIIREQPIYEVEVNPYAPIVYPQYRYAPRPRYRQVTVWDEYCRCYKNVYVVETPYEPR